MQDKIQNLFSIESFGTFAGASGAVMVLSNTLRALIKIDSPWPAFFISLTVSFIGAYSIGKWYGLSESFLIVVNGCLLFWTATGIQEQALGIKNLPKKGEIVAHGRRPVAWFSRWFHGNDKS